MKAKKNKTRSDIAAEGLISGGLGVGISVFIAVSANSLALWADMAATVIGFLAVLIAWWGLKKSESGKTDTYNYGFGRLESLSSILIAMLMVISFCCIMVTAGLRFANPVAVGGLGVVLGIGIHIIFGFINIRLMLKSLHLERKEKTPLVSTQRRVFTIKAVTNVLMFGSLSVSFFLSSWAWAGYVDPVVATLIALTLIAGASKMFKFSVRDLLDYAVEEQSQLLIIRALTRHFDQYEQIRDIRTRCAGGKVYVEIFLEFSAAQAHGEVMTTVRSLQQEIKTSINCDEILIVPV